MITATFFVILQSYLTYAIATKMLDSAVVISGNNVNRMLFCYLSGFCAAAALIFFCVGLIEVISISRKSSLHNVWVRIFWPFVADAIEERELQKQAASVDFYTMKSCAKSIHYLGGDLSKMFYLNNASYCEIVVKDGVMNVFVGPKVKTKITCADKDLTKYRLSVINIVK